MKQSGFHGFHVVSGFLNVGILEKFASERESS